MNVSLSIRPFHDEDLAHFNAWWIARGLKSGIGRESLPSHGIVIEENGKPIVMGFIYVTDSEIGIMEWIVSDPKSSSLSRAKALDVLIKELCQLGKSLGAKFLLTFLSHEKLIEKVIEQGFRVTDKGMTHLIKEL